MQTFSSSDALRVARDLAHAEFSANAKTRPQLPERLACTDLSWQKDGDAAPHWIDADSLAQVSAATAAATWCNAHSSGYSDLFLAKRHVADWAAVMLRAREGGARDFSFATSGSTGERKIIRHREAVLVLEAQAWMATLRQHGFAPKRVVVCCPVHHIYGFIWGVLLPHAANLSVMDATLDALPDLSPGDVIVAVPDQWAWLAKSRSSWPQGCIGISSTAALAPELHAQLNAAGLPLWQIYGSSETAGLAFRHDPHGPYHLFGNRLRVGNGVSQRMPDGQVFDLAVQDQLAWQSDSTFRLQGRLDHQVQVGGHNVSPNQVRELLLEHPDVQDAVVRLNTGVQPPRLKAFLVPKPNATLNMLALEGWAHAHISAALGELACPTHYTYGAVLPTNAMGKLSNW